MKKLLCINILSGFFYLPVTVFAETLEVGGKAKLNGLLQTWFVHDTTTGSAVEENFKIRRAEVKLSGSVVEGTRWFAVMDIAKTLKYATPQIDDGKVLQDIGVGFNITPYLEIVMGQMKTPMNWESGRSSGDLLLPERSMVTRAYGDRRDIGVMFNYNFLENGKINFMVSNGVNSNGKSTNLDETNSSKDVNARAEYDFGKNKLGLYGGSMVAGDQTGTKTINTQAGIDYMFEYDSWLLVLDYISTKADETETVGGVVTLGYQFASQFQLVARYENLNTKSTPEQISEVTSASLNYQVLKTNAEIQLGYSNLRNAKGNGGSYQTQANISGDLTVLAFQAKF